MIALAEASAFIAAAALATGLADLVLLSVLTVYSVCTGNEQQLMTYVSLLMTALMGTCIAYDAYGQVTVSGEKGSRTVTTGEVTYYAKGGYSWYKPDGSPNYPPNGGAVPGTEMEITLKKGTIVGRYGEIRDNSCYVTQAGASAGELALPPDTDPNVYTELIVSENIPYTIQAEIRAWGGSPGGGLQYKLPMPIEQLKKEGFLKER